MTRSRVIQTTSAVLVFTTVVVAVASACSYDAFDPCKSTPSQIQSRGQVDGIWGLTSVNGASPASFDLPFTDDVLISGSIDFATRKTEGPCDKIERSSGFAVARYLIRKPDASFIPKRYVGRFVYDHTTRKLTLSAAGYQVGGTVSGNTMNLPASHDLFGTAELVLTR